MDEIKILLKATSFAADKHKFQRRKGSLNIPYINHPIKASMLIANCNETDIDLLVSALLHDIIEDTETNESELSDTFNPHVAAIVKEVTDDMSLSRKVRKEIQIQKAPGLSREAKIIKIADKVSNIEDIIAYPLLWTRKRKLNYIVWANLVFEGCRGQNQLLDNKFLEIFREGISRYKE
jgi:GTP diphosphokinase / guanosine-3',5'-bis(diphosphate) 3'-diphosphatase